VRKNKHDVAQMITAQSDVDECCIDHLLKRLNDGGPTKDFGSDADLLQAVGEAMANNQKDIMTRFEGVQKGMPESLNNQSKQYEKVASAVEKQLEAIGDRAENYEKKLDDEFFGNLEHLCKDSTQVIGTRSLRLPKEFRASTPCSRN